MKLVYLSSALADLRNIHDYIAKDDPTVAVTVIARIKASLDRLLDFPKSGRAGTVPGTMELVVTRAFPVHLGSPKIPYLFVLAANSSSQMSPFARDLP